MSLLTVNLEKKLISAKKATIARQMSQQEGQDSLLTQANELLQNSAREDLNLLMKVGFHNAIQASQHVQYETDRNKELLNKLNTNPRIFTKDEIKSLCVNYGLRFLSVKHYEGSVPSDIAVKIKDAYAANSMEVPERDPYYYSSDSSTDLMIIAPKESFKLQERPKDPLLFLKLWDGTYYLVAKWGNDLNIMRYVYNIPFRNLSSGIWTCVILLSLTILTMYLGFVVLPLLSIVSAIVLLVFIINKSSDNKFNEDIYNSSFKD